MKKRFLSALICLVMIFSLSAASAETGFVNMLYLLVSDDCAEEYYYMGQDCTVTDTTNDDKIAALIYDIDNKTLNLIGNNSSDKPVLIQWSNVEFGTGLVEIVLMCSIYDTIAGVMDEGYSLIFAMYSPSDETKTISIQSSEAAARFCSSLETYLSSQGSGDSADSGSGTAAE